MIVRSVKDQVFERQPLEVDGTTFERCKFKECRIIFSAIDNVTFKDCTFIACNWVFDGPAETMLDYLSALYHGLGPAGPTLVEDIFQGIRDGSLIAGRIASPYDSIPQR